MSILVYISHPAQFHFFKNIILNLIKDNHDVSILIKKKDILEDLIKVAGFPYKNILPEGRKNNKLSLLLGLFKRDIRLFKIVVRKKPDLFMGSDPSLAHIGRLFKIPIITCLEDDYEVIPFLGNLTYPFTTHILVPENCSVGRWTSKKIGYNGYMKLAYLHPNYFKPDASKINDLDKQKYFLIRLSNLNAHHDAGKNGIDNSLLERLILLLSKYGKIYISSENPLDNGLSPGNINIKIEDMHHYLYYTELLISNSQSMSVEASMLGTPSIRFSDFAGKISVLEELEHKYGLTFGINTSKPEKLFDKIQELLEIKDLKSEWRKKRNTMLADKIDVTAFMTWFIEEYPDTVEGMKNNPELQNKFQITIDSTSLTRNVRKL